MNQTSLSRCKTPHDSVAPRPKPTCRTASAPTNTKKVMTISTTTSKKCKTTNHKSDASGVKRLRSHRWSLISETKQPSQCKSVNEGNSNNSIRSSKRGKQGSHRAGRELKRSKPVPSPAQGWSSSHHRRSKDLKKDLQRNLHPGLQLRSRSKAGKSLR